MVLKDQLKAGRGTIDRLMAKIPGFKGYKEREIRRDADRLVRQHVSRLLEEERKRLSGLQVELVQAAQIDLLDDVERVGTKLQTVINKLKTASYGYAGLFDAAKINEEQLDLLYRFDAGLVQYADSIHNVIDKLSEAVSEKTDMAASFKSLNTLVDKLGTTVRGRESVVLGTGLTDDLAAVPPAEPKDRPK